MTGISNAKLARLAIERLNPFDRRLLKVISRGRGAWAAYQTDRRYDAAMRKLIDYDLVLDAKTVTVTGRLVLDELLGESHGEEVGKG